MHMNDICDLDIGITVRLPHLPDINWMHLVYFLHSADNLRKICLSPKARGLGNFQNVSGVGFDLYSQQCFKLRNKF